MSLKNLILSSVLGVIVGAALAIGILSKEKSDYYRGCVASAYQSTDIAENLKYCNTLK